MLEVERAVIAAAVEAEEQQEVIREQREPQEITSSQDKVAGVEEGVTPRRVDVAETAELQEGVAVEGAAGRTSEGRAAAVLAVKFVSINTVEDSHENG